MKVVEAVPEMRAARAALEESVGFAPTMGYLHEGHLSLVQRARTECRSVVVSIFVNPSQFGSHEDFARYPRDFPRDLRMCEAAGVDVVFAPPSSAVYPEGFRTSVEVHELQDLWEGESRPGHFRGVATVVALLFRIVQPARAYFGEKDYQQLQIVRRLAADLRLDVDVVPCPTVREPDGLARSSRNVYLEGKDRQRAAVLYRALCAAQERLLKGERSAKVLGKVMKAMVEETPGVNLDYAAVVDPETLAPLERVDREGRALIAARIGGVRLIDNIALLPN